MLRAAAVSLYTVNSALLHTLFRLRVHGREHLPEQGPVVFVCNHTSSLDPFAVAASLSLARMQTLYWGGWTGVAFTNPLTRFASRVSQIIPIDPRRGVRTSLALAASVLEREHGLIWFPEGQRSESGELLEFRPGIGMLLERFPVPVVPVAIRGAFEAMPPGQRIPRPGRLSVRFGEPLDPRELERQGKGEDGAARIVDALHDHLLQLQRQSAPGSAAK
jgi:long-chain acyl-CoA synthetase